MTDASIPPANSTMDVKRENVRVGDWIVFRTTWDYCAGRVDRVTAQRAYVSGQHTRYRKFADYSDIEFCGTEAVATLLLQQFVGSLAQRNEEKRKAELRHQERVKSFVAKAPPPPAGEGTKE